MKNKEEFLKKVGLNIKQIRKAKKQEVKEAASGLGITIQAVGAIENGKVDLNISRLFEIAQYFEVDYSKILSVENGDVFNFTSQNNSGGYHVLNRGILNFSDETLRNYFENELAQLKEKIKFFDETFSSRK
jgi:transcriptional regulator with XRE-family HTH domain